MTKLDAGLMTSLPASDPGSAAVWGSKRINPRPQSCLCLTWSGYPSNDDDDELREALLKLLPFQTCLLLFKKQNTKGIRKVYIIFLAETDPNKCSVRAMFERAQKEVFADGMKLYYKCINLFSLLLYVETMKESLVAYECIRLKNASDVEKLKLCEISQFLASFSTNSKNAVMPDLNDHPLFSEK